MDYEAANGDRYDGSFYLDAARRPQTNSALTDSRPADEAPRYERDNRSVSPRPIRDDGDSGRRRSASPAGNGDRYANFRPSQPIWFFSLSLFD